jgi:uncharacterized protein (DUF1499 family)
MMLKWLLIALGVLAALVVLGIAAGQAGLLNGTPPTDLGVRNGRLKGLPASPNVVSSQASLYPDHPQRAYADIAPLSLKGDGAATMARLKAVVEGMPGAREVRSSPDYLHAEFTTPLMKYVDDVEFWFDPAAQAVQLRSASRLGESDLGANRKRIEAIRAALAVAP